ncbi:hypothetical protein GCM10027446_00070 [Angustibacter peucedani]
MQAEGHGGADTDTVLVDADEDRWQWRARLKRNPTTRRLYRGAVLVVGLALLVVGIIAIPLPGPGWALVFVALAVLASEFEPADRLLQFARRHVRRWTTWIGDQPLWVRGVVALATLALVLALFWTYFALTGVPGWLPDVGRDLLLQVPGLGG